MVVGRNSAKTKQNNLLPHLSTSDPPAYLVVPINKIKDASFVTPDTPTAFYFSINRCHLVSKVHKYSPQFLRSCEVSRTKNNFFYWPKTWMRKNFQKVILGLGHQGQDQVCWVTDCRRQRTQHSEWGSGRSQCTRVPLWPHSLLSGSAAVDSQYSHLTYKCLVSEMKTGPTSSVWHMDQMSRNS